MGTLQALTGDEMSEEGTKVTIRMGPEEIQLMEDYMADHDIGNRSDFIRDAISGYIEAQTKPVSDAGSEGGVFIHLSEVQLATLEMLKRDGICFSVEEFARKCIVDRIVSPESEQEAVSRALKAAQLTSRMK